MRSPIKYYGGKSYMTSEIISRFPSDFKTYVEGFGGGASVLFSKQPNGSEIYNDLYEGVYSLFCVLHDEEMFSRLKHAMDMSVYSRQVHDSFAQDIERGGMGIEQTAFKFLYVNRSSFNGVGGFSVSSNYVRRNMCKSASDWLSMIDGLDSVHAMLSTVVIEHMDIFDLIGRYDDRSTFFYLDPPYIHSTRKSSQRYAVEIGDEEHIKLVDTLIGMKSKVLMTVYDHPIYERLTGANFVREKVVRPNSNDTETIYRNY